jgi:hypothetical protein
MRDDVEVLTSSSFRKRLVIVVALFVTLGGGGFFAILALDEGKDELGCSLVGCSSGIDAVLGDTRRTFHRASTVEFCANGECRSVPVAAANVVGTEWATRKLDTQTLYTVDLYIRDRLGRVLMHARARVRLHKFEPNGHACGPTCYSASLHLDAARRQLVPARS